MECPVCKETMSGSETKYRCNQCETSYKVNFTCEKCGNQPQPICSCAAVNFFCNHCNELKSRQKMKKEFIKE